MLISAPTATTPSHRKSPPTATGDSTMAAPSPRASPKHWLPGEEAAGYSKVPRLQLSHKGLLSRRTYPLPFQPLQMPHWSPAEAPSSSWSSGLPCPGSQSFMLRVLTLIRVGKHPGHRTSGMSAMRMVVAEEEEVGKSWDRATTIPSGKQGKCVPGIPIWT